MAAVASPPTVNITVNGIPIDVPKGEMIVESVKRIGVEIPIFCYHPRMKPVGMCRMCLVEIGTKGPDGSVRMMPKPQAACSLPASEGLVILTDTERLHADRRGVLEFLLINHPLDCPICDRGGECPLQNNTLFYGPSTSRYVEMKRHAPKAVHLSKYVTLDLERCIQCGRCVRFTEEISGDGQLGFNFRGAGMQPGTFDDTDFNSKFSGNVIEICPVGALTNSKYRFRARPWDLQTRPAVCTECGNGCNVYFDTRGNKVVRINARTNEAVNEEWTCDKGKFGHDYYNSEKRTTRVFVRNGSQLVAGEWSQAFSEILKHFRGVSGNSVAALAGPKLSNEDLYLLQRLFRREFKSNNLDYRFTTALPGRDQQLPAPQNTLADFEMAKQILVFGSSLADEEPILFLRVRKAWYQHASKVIVASDKPTDVDSFAHLLLTYKPGTAAVLAEGLRKGEKLDQVAKITGVDEAKIKEAIEILSQGAATITTHALLNEETGLIAAHSVKELAHATGGTFSHFGLTASAAGAELVGFTPDAVDNGISAGLGTHGILQGCIDGTVKALWLAGVDLFTLHPDRALVEQALENVEFLVVQTIEENETTAFASVILPLTAPAESDGSYTNIERRVQRFRNVLPSKGDAKPAWKSYAELGLRLTPERPLFHPSEVMERMAEEIPTFQNCSYAELDDEGILLR